MHRARAVVLVDSGDGMIFGLIPLRFYEMVLVQPASMSVMEQAIGDAGRPVLTLSRHGLLLTRCSKAAIDQAAHLQGYVVENEFCAADLVNASMNTNFKLP